MKSIDKQAFDEFIDSMSGQSPESIVELLRPVYEAPMIIHWYIAKFYDLSEDDLINKIDTTFTEDEVDEWREESMAAMNLV